MGGWGSGGWQSGKCITSDYCSLDVRRLKRDGLLVPGYSFGRSWTRSGKTIVSIRARVETDRIILEYQYESVSRDWRHMGYPVIMCMTDCHLGGQRVWLRCPARGCARRVALLYLGSSGIFACRKCYDLAYASQREVGYDRSARRANKIRDRLGWEPGILNGEGNKPKGMHWRTFERLYAEHHDLVNSSLAGIMQRCNMEVSDLE